MQISTIFDFVRFSMDDTVERFHPAEELDWEQLYDFAVKQAIVGVMFHGIEKMAGEQKPPKPLLMKWYMKTDKLKKKNQQLNARAVEIAAQFQKDGFLCCILKGQGNAQMYPIPSLRTLGDIDIWMKPQKGETTLNAVRQAVNDYVRKISKSSNIRYYHAEFRMGTTLVEAHYMPGIMNNPMYNKRLQRFYSERQDEQCAHHIELPGGVGKIPVPTVEFNVVFQLSHMMHHFFDEGIGLRQMMDYYYVLKALNAGDKKSMEKQLTYLGLKKFAGAVMYIQQQVFGLEDDCLLVPVDEKRGKTLMYEILKGGNFGQHSGLTDHGTATKYMLKNWRSLQLVREYPAEALSEPLFRTYHFFWRLRNK